jgi:hypothetical protein
MNDGQSQTRTTSADSRSAPATESLEGRCADVVRAPHRLLILACSSTKRRDRDWIPAIERYDGPLWQTLRACDPQRHGLAVMALSARYGFIAASKAIEHYDERLTPELAESLVNGTPFPGDKWRPAPINEVRDLQGNRRGPFNDICLVGGWLYVFTMREKLVRWQRNVMFAGHSIATDARVTEINGPIGSMRRQLRQWVEA